MPYLYQDMRDKTPEGILKETTRGLAVMACHFEESYGLPMEMTREFIKNKDPIDNAIVYMKFRNDYPELYKDFD